MNLEKFIAVSGLPGVYKVAANKNNGLIIEDLETGKHRFVSARKHQFTPLESISIYIDSVDDSTQLSNVFRSMLEKVETNPPVSHKSSKAVLEEYFAKVLPEYDRDRVYPSDIKKVVKWFSYLHQHNLLSLEEEEETVVSQEEE